MVYRLGQNSAARDINDEGAIAGYSQNASGEDRAFLHTTTVGMVDLGTLTGGNYSRAFGINEENWIVGTSYILNNVTGNVVNHAFLWDGSSMIDLGAYPPEDDIDSTSGAYAIDNQGRVAGYVDLAGVIWHLERTPTHPPFPPTTGMRFHGEFAPSVLYDIEDSGTAVGEYTSTEAAFFYNRPEGTQFFSERPVEEGVHVNASRARGVDLLGRAAGYAELYTDEAFWREAVYWKSPDEAVFLGTLGGEYSVAYDTNLNQLVVGYSENAEGNDQAFVWHETMGMHALPSLGGDNSRAYAINASGQIVGESETASGETHATLWFMQYNIRDRENESDESDLIVPSPIDPDDFEPNPNVPQLPEVPD